MSYTAFQALVWRDLRLFFQDKRAVTMSFVAPIVIASFFGYIFGGVADDRPASKIAVAVVDMLPPLDAAQVGKYTRFLARTLMDRIIGA